MLRPLQMVVQVNYQTVYSFKKTYRHLATGTIPETLFVIP